MRKAIRDKYVEVAVSAAGKFKYTTGRAGARALGYDPDIVRNTSDDFLESFCGVGNPFTLGEIRPGESVLDIGCGVGFDMSVASRLVGETGQVCGIDLTVEMIEQARQNLSQAGMTNVEIKHVDSEEIPYADQTFDVVISNGVINLSLCKEKLFKEIYRVLKPGGRLQFADIAMEKEMPGSIVGSLEAWSQ